jgi:hypothetical protein
MAAVSSAPTFDVFFSYNWRDRAANLSVCVDEPENTFAGASSVA